MKRLEVLLDDEEFEVLAALAKKERDPPGRYLRRLTMKHINEQASSVLSVQEQAQEKAPGRYQPVEKDHRCAIVKHEEGWAALGLQMPMPKNLKNETLREWIDGSNFTRNDWASDGWTHKLASMARVLFYIVKGTRPTDLSWALNNLPERWVQEQLDAGRHPLQIIDEAWRRLELVDD